MGCTLCHSGTVRNPSVSEGKPCPSPEGGLDLKGGRDPGGEGGMTAPDLFPLSEAQKGLVRDSWKTLHQDIAGVGIIVFIRLFETHPECKEAFFLFQDLDDLQQLKTSKDFQAHSLRVMSFIEKSVARLDQEEKLEHLAMELGRSHFWYKAPPKYYECIGTQFIQAVRPILKEAWSPEVEKAWQGLFQYLVATMHRGFCAEEKTVWANPSLHSRKAGSESRPDWRV